MVQSSGSGLTGIHYKTLVDFKSRFVFWVSSLFTRTDMHHCTLHWNFNPGATTFDLPLQEDFKLCRIHSFPRKIISKIKKIPAENTELSFGVNCIDFFLWIHGYALSFFSAWYYPMFNNCQPCLFIVLAMIKSAVNSCSHDLHTLLKNIFKDSQVLLQISPNAFKEQGMLLPALVTVLPNWVVHLSSLTFIPGHCRTSLQVFGWPWSLGFCDGHTQIHTLYLFVTGYMFLHPTLWKYRLIIVSL